MPMWSSLSFQDSCSPTMEQLTFFHDHTMIVLITVTVLTVYLIMSMLFSKHFHLNLLEAQEIETIWTIMPATLLIFIALPSLKVLYLMEESSSPSMTVKAMGHQWYWSYEYSDFEGVEYDSYMTPSQESTHRLMESGETLVLPINTTIRMLVGSADVIHSWAMPSAGAKADAMPGRLNQMFLLNKRSGTFIGQCSEICGANHSFMPIVMNATSMEEFKSWVENKS